MPEQAPLDSVLLEISPYSFISSQNNIIDLAKSLGETQSFAQFQFMEFRLPLHSFIKYSQMDCFVPVILTIVDGGTPFISERIIWLWLEMRNTASELIATLNKNFKNEQWFFIFFFVLICISSTVPGICLRVFSFLLFNQLLSGENLIL